MHGSDSVWVFGYGSLIWRPGFDYLDMQDALLRGAHRALCVYSHKHRGTIEQPGLVFGLMPGGSCRGRAFAVSQRQWPDVLDYLREREQANNVYKEQFRAVRLGDGRQVNALTFMVDRGHHQFAGRLPLDEQVRLIRTGHGESGPNVEYVLNTSDHLERMGVTDRHLVAIRRQLGKS